MMNQTHDLFGMAPPSNRFQQDGYSFLVEYAKARAGQSFSSEEVSLAAAQAGIDPIDRRQWGAYFQRAATAGLIRRSEQLFKLRTSNGSLSPGWTAV